MLHTIKNFNEQFYGFSNKDVGGEKFLIQVLFAETGSNYERVINYRSGPIAPIAENCIGSILIRIDPRYMKSQTDGYCLFYKDKSKLYHYQTFASGEINRRDIEQEFFKVANELTGLEVIEIPSIEPDRTRKLDHPITPVNNFYDASSILQSFLETQINGCEIIENTGVHARFLCEPHSVASFETYCCFYELEVRISRADSTHSGHAVFDDSDKNGGGYIIFVQVREAYEVEPLASMMMGAVGTTLTLLDYKISDWDEEDDIVEIVLDMTASYLHETFAPQGLISLPVVDSSPAIDVEAQTAA